MSSSTKDEALTLRVVGGPAAAAAVPAPADAADVVLKPAAAATPPAAPAAAPAEPADDGFKLRGLPFLLVMFAMCLAVFIGGLDGTIVVVAMPKIATEFDALSLISWIFLSFLLTQTAGTPLWGRASDMLGRKTAMLVAIGSFVVGSIACALSTTFPMLAIFRAVQGVGGGGLMSVALILLADIVPAAQRGAYLAPINSMFALSSVVGPILGGYITDGPGWRWCFWSESTPPQPPFPPPHTAPAPNRPNRPTDPPQLLCTQSTFRSAPSAPSSFTTTCRTRSAART